MQTRIGKGSLPALPALGLSQSWERGICALQHLRVLPVRTRPSLFGGD